MNDRLMDALLSFSADGIAGIALDRVAIAAPGPNEVRIRVRVCTISYPDLLMLKDMYQARPARPFSPGMEIAGEIDAVGADVAGRQVGDRVFASIPHGGMAQYALAPSGSCTALPADMPYEHGAIFLSSYGTAYHALTRRGSLKPGERLLVLGAASGVGLSAVQLGKALGAHVIAAASSEEKVALAREHGADTGIVHPAEGLDPNQAKAFTNELKALCPEGIDVVCDIIGGPFTEAALRAIAWEGRLLIIGFPAGIAKLPMNLPLLKGCQVIGVFYGSYIQHDPEGNDADVRALFDLYETGCIAPYISGRYALANAAAGFAQLENRRAMGKVIVTMT